MKNPKIFLLLLMILPWFTLPLLGKSTAKKYFLASLFISLVVRGESIVAKKRKWWKFHATIHPKVIGEFPLIWGPFLIGSMWILKFTYGKFFAYIILNLIIDSIFVYPYVSFLKKSGIGTLKRLKSYQLSLLFFIKSLLLYGFQYLNEKVKNYRAIS
ncbi:hypothetical protein JOC85_000643 [Bacillus mesophilus]|uniref:Uncharacterized protein n=1 Tax=Bacillus mesophilus TaxID=1808955 RepID=A0A6M0Q2X6_9BACI|nr:hypothetical protein [Bacillus mesophilus]MBM7659876.1 hypothetical protein [Bacillus mesophilus]NEY70735.1 hypothetical protein [Bacillus mesophilus]